MQNVYHRSVLKLLKNKYLRYSFKVVVGKRWASTQLWTV